MLAWSVDRFRPWRMHILLWGIAALITVSAFRLLLRFSAIAASDESVVRGMQINEGAQALFSLMIVAAIILTLWGFVVRNSDAPANGTDERPTTQLPRAPVRPPSSGLLSSTEVGLEETWAEMPEPYRLEICAFVWANGAAAAAEAVVMNDEQGVLDVADVEGFLARTC